MPRETRGKKRISKARFAGKFDFFDKLMAAQKCAALINIKFWSTVELYPL